MPVLLAPVIAGALSATALSSTAIFAVSTIAANAIVAGAALGLQLALQPGQQKQKVSSQQYQSRQALPPLMYGYGVDKLGGAKFVFENAAGTYLDGLIHCAGPIHRIEAWILNDQGSGIPADTATGDGVFGGPNRVLPWGINVVIETHKGAPTQTASGALLGRLPGKWTAQHRLDGLCYSVLQALPVKEKVFQKVYPNGPPALYILAYLALVYDPRKPEQIWTDPSTWGWSVNPALAILNYLTAIRGVDSVSGQPVPYGFGIRRERIDLASFRAFADVCDQLVGLKNATVEQRYTLGGTFDMASEERKDVLAKLLSSCDGEIYQTADGKIAIRGGVWTAPTVTITAEHVLAYDYEGGSDKLAAFNRLKITFKDPFNDHQQIEADPWDDLAAQALSGEVLTQDLSLPMVQSHSQARRLAKIATAKGNPRHKLTITTDLYGLLALGERVISIDLPELGLADTFLVTSFTESSDSATCRIGLSSLNAAAYAWDAAREEGTRPAVAQGLVQPTTVPDIRNLVLSVERTTVSGSVTGLAIRARVDAPVDTAFALVGRIRPLGATDWQDMQDDGRPWSVVYGPASDGQDYEVQVSFQAPYGGTQGPWTATQIVRAVADQTPPGPPTGFVASGGAGQYRYAFTAPNSANFGSVVAYRGTTSDIADAVQTRIFNGAASQSFDMTESGIAPGTYRLWVRALNRSGFGDGSSTAGPIVATVT